MRKSWRNLIKSMNENKIYSLLSLCMKAGELITGEFGCENAVRENGKVKLLILAADSSQNTKKKFTNLTSHYNVKLLMFGNLEMLGQKTGKEKRAVLAVTSDGF